MVLYKGIFPLLLLFCADILLGINRINAKNRVDKSIIFFIFSFLYHIYISVCKSTQISIMYKFRFIKMKIVLCNARY